MILRLGFDSAAVTFELFVGVAVLFWRHREQLFFGASHSSVKRGIKMRIFSRWTVVALMVAVIVGLPTAAWSQATGQLAGTVTDESGSVSYTHSPREN